MKSEIQKRAEERYPIEEGQCSLTTALYREERNQKQIALRLAFIAGATEFKGEHPQEFVKDFEKVPLGLYKIYWKEERGGGMSLAAVGNLHSGERWVAPINWTNESNPIGHMNFIKPSIEKMVLIPLSSPSTSSGGEQSEMSKEKFFEIIGASWNNHVALTIWRTLEENGYVISQSAIKKQEEREPEFGESTGWEIDLG